uniref:2-dehydropantoate 2-reductase n=1 Tax=Chromera velia CCMP2878 TaxID=1169474 RepID=A0A0G4HKB3_9ALVE|eukprot:Cvel_28537.t1-p1 / transcript=Cvel_28537.t1 / gene=Cvel_28537 / organism=Chromera_velia_CCMP2878 / gene_product=Putative 2-dehydropantoate 2-reductase, putative / transcript_product=Putative 2-dehydropantoate 2-reductase, putative / location=Cvel_scaffold3757:3524-7129(+) / protein_length=398 / sequence_SO=supercontig / SO=protein_coding / is_pseudo=false
MSTQPGKVKVCVVGAGNVGCYIGGRLVSGGHEVTLVGRRRLVEGVASRGLRVTSFDNEEVVHISVDSVRVVESIPRGEAFDAVFVTTKCAAVMSDGFLENLGESVSRETAIVMVQNGVRSLDFTREKLPSHRIVGSVFSCNVQEIEDFHFHRGMKGGLFCEEGLPENVFEALISSRLSVERHPPAVFRSMMWGKFVVNMNNSVNALSGLPLRDQVSNPTLRKCVALCMEEAIRVAKAGGEAMKGLYLLPVDWFPSLFRLPNFIFLPIAGKLLAIDGKARSSMWDDLARGRPTEVEFLNGEVVRLGETLSVSTPVNAEMLRLVREAEQKGLGALRGQKPLSGASAGGPPAAACAGGGNGSPVSGEEKTETGESSSESPEGIPAETLLWLLTEAQNAVKD